MKLTLEPRAEDFPGSLTLELSGLYKIGGLHGYNGSDVRVFVTKIDCRPYAFQPREAIKGVLFEAQPSHPSSSSFKELMNKPILLHLEKNMATFHDPFLEKGIGEAPRLLGGWRHDIFTPTENSECSTEISFRGVVMRMYIKRTPLWKRLAG